MLAWFSYRKLQVDMLSSGRNGIAFQGAPMIYLGYASACQQSKRRHVDPFKRSGYSPTAVIYYGHHCASFKLELIALHGDVSSNPSPLARNDTTNETSTISNNSHPTFPIKSKGLKVCHLNVRSLPRHLEEVKTLMNLNDFDVFAMSKTWLNSTWSDCVIASMNYQIHRCDRSDSKRGGGVAVYVNNTLICHRVRLLDPY